MKAILLLSILINLTNFITTNNKDEENFASNSFKDYLSTFTQRSLPIKFDRVTTFSYMSVLISDTLDMQMRKTPYPQIDDKYSKFIPQKLWKDKKTSSLRSIFVFPENDGVIPVIIGLDEFRDFDDKEQNILKLYFITYDKNGKVISYINLAGYNLDLWEQFATINNTKTIKTFKYFYDDSIPENPLYYSFKEIETLYRVDNEGNILKMNEQKKVGYFKERGKYGYIFIKGI